MKSLLFDTDKYLEVGGRVVQYLNRQDFPLSKGTANSPRAVGDAIQDNLSANFQELVGTEFCAKYSAQFARRAMADLAFEDTSGCYYVVDVKTQRLDTKFNMPNLTSVERLVRFYEDDRNYFVMLMIKYDMEGLRMVVRDSVFVPIEFISWECLTVGALGWGQIQIANANAITINPRYSRKKWMVEFCDIMLEFYPREIGKIGNRMKRFEEARALWVARSE